MKLPAALACLLALCALIWAFGGFGPGVEEPAPAGESQTSAPVDRERVGEGASADLRMGVRVSERFQLASDERSVEVRVLAPDDEPAAGVKLTLFRLVSPWPERRAEPLDQNYTNDDGLCHFRAPVGDELLVEILHADYARKEIVIPAELDRRTARLEPGFEVSGLVTLGRNGSGAANVPVTLEPGPLDVRRARTVRTDQTGRFRFRNVAAGASGVVRVTARHEKFAPVTVSGVPVGSGQFLRLAFRDFAASMIGMVRSVDGEPIDRAVVSVYPTTAWNAGLYEPFRAETAIDGSFEITGLRSGAVRVVVRHPKYSTIERSVSLHARSEQHVEMFPRAEVSGRLLGEIATPFEQLSLRLRTETGELARCDVRKDGSFRFPASISVGKAALAIERGLAAFSVSFSREHWLSIETGNEPIELEVRDPSALVGRVVDARGAPVVGAEIAVPRSRLQPLNSQERFWTTSNASGEFRLRGLPPGPTRLSIGHPDRASLVELVDVGTPGGETSLGDLVLADPLRISGQVAQGGTPLPGVSVFARRGELIDSAVSTRDGSFAIRSLPPGKFRLFARYAGRVKAVEGALEIGPGMPAADVAIEFPKVRRLRFRVVDTDGEAVSLATLTVVARGEKAVDLTGLLPTASDSQGFAELELPEDLTDLKIEVDAPNGTLRQEFDIEPRESARSTPQELRLSLLPRGRLKARLRLPRTTGVSSAILRLTPLDAPKGDPSQLRQRIIESRVVDLNGGRLEEVLPAGRSLLTLEIPGFRPFRREIDLDPNRERRLPMIQLLSGAEFEGRIVNGAGQPIPGAFVHRGQLRDLFEMPFGRSIDSGLAGLAVQTDADGRFALRGIGPRSNRVIVAAPGYMAREVRLSLPEDLLKPREIELREASSLVLRQTTGSDARLVGLFYDDRLFDIGAPDEDGVVRFELYIPGKYSVAEYQAPAERRVEIEVTEEPRVFTVIELEGGKLQLTR